MKWSELRLKTFKEKPAGSSLESHSLLLRSGSIYSTSQGIFCYNSLFLRSIRKLENIIREELESQGAREILMPMVQSKNLWEEAGRWNQFEGLLQKMTNRANQEFCLGPTHEEVVTDFVRSSLTSYKEMPLNLYQIQTKFRDEIRARFGLMRAKEFIMKDAYSFDTSSEDALKAYQKMFQAYKNIFDRLGVKYVVVKADSGAIGGKHSEEFHVLADKGEDEILVCDEFSANVEVCPRKAPDDKNSEAKNSEAKTSDDKNSEAKTSDDKTSEALKEIEEFATPNITSISDLSKFLKLKDSDLVKILFFVSQDSDQDSSKKANKNSNKNTSQDSNKNSSEEKQTQKVFAVLCLGDDEVNPVKLKQNLNLKADPLLASEQIVQEITGAKPGSCGPCDLKIPIYLDNFLKNKKNFITGANKDGVHLKNINSERDFKVEAYGDFCFTRESDLSPQGFVFKKYRGIEVGHLFYLSQEYSKKMNLTYLDKLGKKQFVEMGCYGLGVTRTLQAVVEQSHDDKGIIWPASIAPFAVHICLIDINKPEIQKTQETLISILKQHRLDYFIDDRKERPGVKFKDADLLGLPLRINIGLRDLQNQQIEISIRSTGEKQKLTLEELKNKLPSLLSF